MTTKTKQQFNFEAALQELTTLVEAMEHGDLELEASLKQFEQGIALIRNCQTALKDAEQKVQILVEKDKLEPYEIEE